MAFSNAANFQIDRSTFNDIQGDYNQQINVHGDQDIRNRVHLAMEPYICTDAFHNSGARRDPSSCYPGTREAALETIARWIGDSASHCLWLHGPAGTGKSAIAQTVAERCDWVKTLGASYFFTRGSVNGSRPLFPTLAYQLMWAVPDLDAHLWEMICEDRTVFKRSMTEQLDRLIVRPFLKLVNRPAHVVVVVDGLDECDGTSVQAEIVRLILGVREHSLPVQFLIASRPESDIRRAFESSPYSPPFYLSLDASLDPDRDIRHFLCSELGRIYRQCVENGLLVVPGLAWPSSEAIDQLVEKSSGHFIYASTVIKFIQEEDAHPVERLDVVLQISSESSSPATTNPSIVSQSAAFQHLDQLYLYILRKGCKAGNRAELVRILYAINTGYPTRTINGLDTIFAPKGGVRFLLRGFRSIIEVTQDLELRFLHASLSDFLNDPARSCEFHLDLGHFNAELAYEYTRLITLLSPIGSPSLRLAMYELGDCLRGTRAHPGLLSTTLKELAAVIDLGLSTAMLPCLRYSGLDYLLRTLEEFPESNTLRNKLKHAQLQLEPQLMELSDTILTLVRVLGANSALGWKWFFRPKHVGRLIGVPNGEEVMQRTLNLNYAGLGYDIRMPIKEIHRSLSRWLHAHRRGEWRFITPIIRRILPPPKIMVDKYTWTWAWDTATYSPDTVKGTVHHLDILYGCLRTLLLEFHRPSSRMLRYASVFVESYLTGHRMVEFPLIPLPMTTIAWVLEGIDFSPVWQALATLGTDFYPRLSFLQYAFDVRRDAIHLANRNPSLDRFLQNMYSRLMQDHAISRAVPLIYAMFEKMHHPKCVEKLLGLGPGTLCHSAAKALFGGKSVSPYPSSEEVLFGVGSILRRNLIWFRLSTWLPELLKNGLVKLHHDLPNNTVDENHYSIEAYMCDAHESLTISCTQRLASHLDPNNASDREATMYARRYWSSHLRCTNHSKRLFKILRRVATVQREDIEDVIQWLQKSPGAPEDILLRWHTARLDHGTEHGLPRNLDMSLFGQFPRN